jgi:hypothetical protein
MARYPVTPDMVSPCEQWSIDDLLQMEQVQNQIDEINAELQRLDDAWIQADSDRNYPACDLIEGRIGPLTEKLDGLIAEYERIGED